MTKPTPEEVGEALALLVHDLRNPAATLGANTGFLSEADMHMAGSDPDIADSIADMSIAMRELMDGFRHFGWLARWLSGNDIGGFMDASAENSLRALLTELQGGEGASAPVEFEVLTTGLVAKGGASLPTLARVFYLNAQRHARGTTVRWSLKEDGEWVVFEHRDQGAAIAPELRSVAFSLEGQPKLKGRRDGRYGRCLSLFSAGIIAERAGGCVEADEDAEHCVFRVRLPRIS